MREREREKEREGGGREREREHGLNGILTVTLIFLRSAVYLISLLGSLVRESGPPRTKGQRVA